jgi:hypothetical protein
MADDVSELYQKKYAVNIEKGRVEICKDVVLS